MDIREPHHQPVDCSDGRLHGQSAGQQDVGQDPNGQEVADFVQVAPPVFNRFSQSCAELGGQHLPDALIRRHSCKAYTAYWHLVPCYKVAIFQAGYHGFWRHFLLQGQTQAALWPITDA